MKILLILPLLVLLAGCPSVPVQRHFPDTIKSLQETCPDLKELPETTEKLSELLDVMKSNYARYHECKGKVDGWLDWHRTQKTIFESVK